jgi:hypothetical protein
MNQAPGGFLSRWARRKQEARAGVELAPEPPAVPVDVVPAPAEAVAAVDPAPAGEPLPTLADVAQLTRESDYSRFVASGVDEGVKRAAMKKLFSDPHFNVMDGLDTYIDDYGKPDPIPLAMLRQLNQSRILRLFDDDDDDTTKKMAAPATPEPVSEPVSPPDDDPDLQLQQDDAAGRPGPGEGTRA